MEEKIVEPGDHVGARLYLKCVKNGKEIIIVNLYDDHQSPAYFFVGEDKMIREVNNVILGMRVGETRKINSSPANAYGIYDPNKILVVPIALIPEIDVSKLSIGTILTYKLPGTLDTVVPVVVTEINKTDKTITLNGNHPYADLEVTGEITITLIEKQV